MDKKTVLGYFVIGIAAALGAVVSQIMSDKKVEEKMENKSKEE